VEVEGDGDNYYVMIMIIMADVYNACDCNCSCSFFCTFSIDLEHVLSVVEQVVHIRLGSLF
jgi:hypothetical protein